MKVDRSPDDVVEGGGDRPRVLRCIVLAASLILLAQALIPLHYYLGPIPTTSASPGACSPTMRCGAAR